MSKSPPNKRKLNELVLRNLKPRNRPYLIWDSLQRGLAVQVQPTGHLAYKAIYARHGRPRWYHLGRADAIGLADARRLAGKVMVLVAEGKDPQADRQAERHCGTFAELAAQYRDHASKKNKSWKQSDALVQKHLMPRWAKLLAAEVTRSDVKAMVARVEAPIVANQVLAAASAIFSWAIKEEVAGVKINPCRQVDRNPTTARERILADSELPKFWAAFDQVGPVEGAALKMILLTGQRPGEVSHMRTEHLVDGWWIMPGKMVPAVGWPGVKNGATHQVWLPKAARQIIEQIGNSGMVFPAARGGAIGGLAAAMQKICRQLGVERATPHDLRRTHGSKVALLCNREVMNRIRNHREGGIADVYDRNRYGEQNKNAMETVADCFMALIEGHDDDDNIVTFKNKGLG